MQVSVCFTSQTHGFGDVIAGQVHLCAIKPLSECLVYLSLNQEEICYKPRAPRSMMNKVTHVHFSYQTLLQEISQIEWKIPTDLFWNYYFRIPETDTPCFYLSDDWCCGIYLILTVSSKRSKIIFQKRVQIDIQPRHSKRYVISLKRYLTEPCKKSCYSPNLTLSLSAPSKVWLETDPFEYSVIVENKTQKELYAGLSVALIRKVRSKLGGEMDEQQEILYDQLSYVYVRAQGKLTHLSVIPPLVPQGLSDMRNTRAETVYFTVIGAAFTEILFEIRALYFKLECSVPIIIKDSDMHGVSPSLLNPSCDSGSICVVKEVSPSTIEEPDFLLKNQNSAYSS